MINSITATLAEARSFLSQSGLDQIRQEELRKEVRAEKAQLQKQITRTRSIENSVPPTSGVSVSSEKKKIYKL